MIVTRSTSAAALRLFFATLPLACLPAGLQAAEDRDQQMPRRSHIQPVGEVAAAAGDTDTLGLRLARASEVLRQQLALARGAGLVVEEVLPGSAGDKAGFKRHDVLVLLDDQMLLLPEQLAALLEAADDGAAPECTVLRGGAKVTIQLGQPGRTTRPTLPAPAKPAGLPPLATTATTPPLPAVRQTAAKPSTSPGLRAPASALALLQPPQPGQSNRAGQKVPTVAPPTAAAAGNGAIQAVGGTTAQAEETLLREDADFHIKLTRGDQTRLVVLDPRGRILFNDEIDTPEHRSLVPPAVRERVAAMERSLESTRNGPAAEIGRLDVPPIELR